jgi:hypothetical protein
LDPGITGTGSHGHVGFQSLDVPDEFRMIECILNAQTLADDFDARLVFPFGHGEHALGATPHIETIVGTSHVDSVGGRRPATGRSQ